MGGVFRSLFVRAEFGIELVGNCAGDFALHAEEVVEFAVVSVSPNVGVGRGVDQLHIHAHGVSRLLHAAFDDVRHTELARDLRDIVGFAPYC